VEHKRIRERDFRAHTRRRYASDSGGGDPGLNGRATNAIANDAPVHSNVATAQVLSAHIR